MPCMFAADNPVRVRSACTAKQWVRTGTLLDETAQPHCRTGTFHACLEQHACFFTAYNRKECNVFSQEYNICQ